MPAQRAGENNMDQTEVATINFWTIFSKLPFLMESLELSLKAR
jgi:hypothetical protein